MSFKTDSFGGGADSSADSVLPTTAYAYGRPNEAKPHSPRLRKTPPPQLDVFRRPAYSCPELGRTSNRPGAYDAYDLPSIYGGVCKPYRFAE